MMFTNQIYVMLKLGHRIPLGWADEPLGWREYSLEWPE